MHCVDLCQSFPAKIYLQILASIQPRTSLVKFARSPRTDPPGDRVHGADCRRLQMGAGRRADPQQQDGAARAAEVRALVERFDIESYSDFSAKVSNIRGFVLGCINADFCKKILIFQHFSRSTRFAILCTAQILGSWNINKNISFFLLNSFFCNNDE